MENNYDKIRKKEEAGLSNYVFGKIPPQARDMEEAVLGACMLEQDVFYKVVAILKMDMFYVDSNQHIFEAMSKLFNRNSPIDLLTVIEQLRDVGKLESIGGAFTITELTNRITSAANVEYYARLVYQKYLGRELIKLSTKAVELAYDDTADILEVISDISKDILLLTNIEATQNVEPISRMLKALNTIQFAMQTGKTITGIPSGMRDIDAITGGWQNEDLIVVAARPGQGKSAVALNFATYASENNYPCYMFSLEMSDVQVAMRELGAKSNLKYSKLRKGEINQEDLNEVSKQSEMIANNPLYIDSANTLNITILRAKLMKAIHEKGIKLAIIDYLSYIDPDKTNRYQSTADAITQIVKDLKRMARQFKIPIILLCQLNREGEKDGTKKPKLHHLKSSGGIEEGADIVMMLYRPAYHDPNAKDQYGNGEENTLYIDFVKHKQGATGEVKLWVDIGKNIIKDWNGNDYSAPQNNYPTSTPPKQDDNDSPF